MLPLLLSLALASALGQPSWDEVARIDGDPVMQGLPRDAIPAIDRPTFAPAREATWMRDHEPVIGVAIGGTARAYPAWLLDSHEIVNDVISGRPIAVTWCPLCYTGIVYARTVGGHDLSFGVSGMLWRDNLVMYDRQTNTWWAQATGDAIRGSLKGHRLDIVSTEMMSWAQWRQLHPDTSVLVGPRGRGRNEDRYVGYHTSRLVGVTERTSGGGSLGAKRRVLGFRAGTNAYAVPLDAFKKALFLRVDAQGASITLVASSDRSTARAFVTGSRRFDVVESNGSVRLRDLETASDWDGFTGTAVSGPLAGQRLEQVPVFQSYWFAWRAFYPRTIVLGR